MVNRPGTIQPEFSTLSWSALLFFVFFFPSSKGLQSFLFSVLQKSRPTWLIMSHDTVMLTVSDFRSLICCWAQLGSYISPHQGDHGPHPGTLHKHTCCKHFHLYSNGVSLFSLLILWDYIRRIYFYSLCYNEILLNQTIHDFRINQHHLKSHVQKKKKKARGDKMLLSKNVSTLLFTVPFHYVCKIFRTNVKAKLQKRDGKLAKKQKRAVLWEGHYLAFPVTKAFIKKKKEVREIVVRGRCKPSPWSSKPKMVIKQNLRYDVFLWWSKLK